MEEMRRLSRFISAFRLPDAPRSVINSARYCVLDSIGAALGAVRYEEIPTLVKELAGWTAEGPPRSAAVWGQGMRTDVFTSLLMNGMLAHALELDDVHAGSKSHIGAVVVPAAWTLSDALGLPGKALLESVIVGYEAMARVGMAMDVASNRRRGWHTTGVIGTFGSAAAAAHLLGLDERRTLFALGMAGTQSSGLWAFLADGATCKKLHTARAAVNGITAAILSKAGMSGPEHILDAEDGGLFAAVSDKYDMSVICSGLGETYEITKIDKKPYPCCRSTHPVIDAALMIRKEKEFLRDRIMDIQVETYEIAVLQCGGRYPQNTVEAKFSIAYTCAVAFIYGKVTLSEFSPRILEDPAVMRIADRVKVVGCRSFTERYPRQWGCRVAVTMKNGDVITRQIDDMSGSVQVPLTEDQEKDKFTASASSAYNDPLRVRRCMEDILHLDSLDRLPDLA